MVCLSSPYALCAVDPHNGSLPGQWRIVDPQPRHGSMVVTRVEDDFHVRVWRIG